MKEVWELTKAGVGEYIFSPKTASKRTRFSPLYLPCCPDSGTLGFSSYSLSLTFLCDANLSGTFFFSTNTVSNLSCHLFQSPFLSLAVLADC